MPFKAVGAPQAVIWFTTSITSVTSDLAREIQGLAVVWTNTWESDCNHSKVKGSAL
jgi:hypothetical protein